MCKIKEMCIKSISYFDFSTLISKDSKHDFKQKFKRCLCLSPLCLKGFNENDKDLVVSYRIAKIITKCGKLCSIGKYLIIPAAQKIINTMMYTN
jgi:hypothetical protein